MRHASASGFLPSANTYHLQTIPPHSEYSVGTFRKKIGTSEHDSLSPFERIAFLSPCVRLGLPSRYFQDSLCCVRTQTGNRVQFEKTDS